ncbi:MAG: hypothetical protein JWP78_2037 [Mucilaginibacter sp.]|nr:hypothetical protein [Mucilaginibacter sp.]
MKGEWIRIPKIDTTVIYVHGILSNGESCWLHQNGTYWPALLESEDNLADLGIYVFSYETGIFSGNYSLNDAVDAMKEYIINLDSVIESKKLVFVCHSMGGIVVRKFLVERSADLIKHQTEVGLFLVASPSLGSAYANLLAPLAKFFGNSQADTLRFQRNNIWLNGLDKEFLNLKDRGTIKISGKELIEDKFVSLPGLFRKQIVEPFSGAHYFGESFKVPYCDHFTIAKPSGKEAIQHRLLTIFLSDFVAPSNPVDAKISDTSKIKIQPQPTHKHLESFYVNNPVPHASKFYVERKVDRDLWSFIQKGSGIASIWGPRSVGKTSLLLKIKEQAEKSNIKVEFISTELLNSGNLDDLLMEICHWLSPDSINEGKSPRMLLRNIMKDYKQNLLLIFDEVDYLIGVSNGLFFQVIRSLLFDGSLNLNNSIFFLFSSFVAPRDYIQDRFVSPFNIGKAFYINNFNFDEFKRLLSNLNTPLTLEGLNLLWDYIGGQPFLTNQAGILLNNRVPLSNVIADIEREAFDFFYHAIHLLLKNDESLKLNLKNFLLGKSTNLLKLKELIDKGILIEENHITKFSCGFYEGIVRKTFAE